MPSPWPVLVQATPRDPPKGSLSRPKQATFFAQTAHSGSLVSLRETLALAAPHARLSSAKSVKIYRETPKSLTQMCTNFVADISMLDLICY